MILRIRHQGIHGDVNAVHTDCATDPDKDPRFLPQMLLQMPLTTLSLSERLGYFCARCI